MGLGADALPHTHSWTKWRTKWREDLELRDWRGRGRRDRRAQQQIADLGVRGRAAASVTGASAHSGRALRVREEVLDWKEAGV